MSSLTKILRWTLALTAIACMATPNAFAAPKSGKGELGIFTGGNIFSSDTELGNPTVAGAVPTNSALIGLRGGYNLNWLFGVEGELKYAPSSFQNTGNDAGVFGFRLNGLVHLMEGNFRPFALVGVGGESLVDEQEGNEKDTDSATHLGLGAKYDVTRAIGLRGDVRYLNTAGTEDYTANQWEFHVGAAMTLGGAGENDDDRDGIPNDKDKCPKRAEDMDGFADSDGCPEADNDGDGVMDIDDRCPNKPETRNGVLDTDGCPDADSDNDGIEDAQDKCPTQAEDKDGVEDEDGCPDIEVDTDNDGIVDAKDKCPNKAETKNGFQDDDGCPDRLPRKIAKTFNGAIKGIQFESGSDVIKESSFRTLDRAIAIMKQYPSVKVEIAGHTDSSGGHDANIDLSQRRAEAVVAYMSAKGIDGQRLKAIGFGPDKPVASNKTRSGRAKNRRIEFHLL